MENFDTEKAARVWQRVQNKPPYVTLPEVLAAVDALIALYRAMIRKNVEKGEFRALLRSAQSCKNCLLGLETVAGRTVPRCVADAPDGSMQSLLCRCCHSENALLHQLMRAASDPDWGSVYASLAQKCSERLFALLQIVGKSNGGNFSNR